jgi:multiple sugar transport system permease protein
MDPQKLSTAIAGGVPPDLVNQDRFTVGDWASRDAFEPLDDLIARDAAKPDGIREKDYYPATWKEAVYEGKVYGVPNTTDDRALYWNKTIFRKAGLDPDKPPRTWEELREVALKLTKYDKQGNITQVGYMPNYGNVWLYMYSWQNEGNFMSPDGRTCTMASQPNVEALQYITDLTKALGG